MAGARGTPGRPVCAARFPDGSWASRASRPGPSGPECREAGPPPGPGPPAGEPAPGRGAGRSPRGVGRRPDPAPQPGRSCALRTPRPLGERDAAPGAPCAGLHRVPRVPLLGGGSLGGPGAGGGRSPGFAQHAAWRVWALADAVGLPPPPALPLIGRAESRGAGARRAGGVLGPAWPGPGGSAATGRPGPGDTGAGRPGPGDTGAGRRRLQRPRCAQLGRGWERCGSRAPGSSCRGGWHSPRPSKAAAGDG